MLNLNRITAQQCKRFREHHRLTLLTEAYSRSRTTKASRLRGGGLRLISFHTPGEVVTHFEQRATSVVVPCIVAFSQRRSEVVDSFITDVITLMDNTAKIAVIVKHFLCSMESPSLFAMVY